MDESFTTSMRRATRNIHSISDQLVNSKLLLAISDETVWSDALLIFYEVFKCLEQYKKEMGMPELDKLYVDDCLLRTAAFERDIAHYLGDNWQKTYSVRSEVVEYLRHLEELREERPLLLLAYVYHLYMGLLSGGQIIKRKRKIAGGVPPPLSFLFGGAEGRVDRVLDFPGEDIHRLKASMKRAMNEIAAELTQEQRYALTNESQMVFVYNNAVVKSVRGTNRAIFWKGLYVVVIVNVLILGYLYLR